MIGYDFVNLDSLTFHLWESGCSSSIKFENEHFWSSELLAGPKTVGAVYDRILPCKARIPLVTRWYCIWQRFEVDSEEGLGFVLLGGGDREHNITKQLFFSRQNGPPVPKRHAPP